MRTSVTGVCLLLMSQQWVLFYCNPFDHDPN